ncbi:MAG: endonuclease III [Clostridia bacterium]|nr:endonuclease III [Clostridia bacterium]
MKTKKEAQEIIKILKDYYPDAVCSLDFTSPFEMMVSVMLAAQCTDERVNKTTPNLFDKYNTPEKMVMISQEELENIIHPCGFYKTKAKNIIATSKILIEKYGGKVPENMKDLQSLPGVGRKSANVIMLEAFHNPQGIAVDTHAKRISNRIGFSNETDPEKVEQDLLKQIPKELYYDVNHLLVWHGRKICDARKPKCDVCPVSNYCKEYRKKK